MLISMGFLMVASRKIPVPATMMTAGVIALIVTPIRGLVVTWGIVIILGMTMMTVTAPILALAG